MARRATLCLAFGLVLLAFEFSSVEAAKPKWKPKTEDSKYNPSIVDWASVVSACQAAGRAEKRLFNFWVRLAFHDALAVDHEACMKGNWEKCNGADGSVFLSADEFTREENAHDGLSDITFRVTRKIASFYDLSLSDTLAVCATVAIEELSHGRVKLLGVDGKPNFKVGRLDNTHTAPVNQLPHEDINEDEFSAFWTKHGFTIEEGVALMGSHSLLELQGCKTGPAAGDMCDPDKPGSCEGKLRMFEWKPHYFHDICTPDIKIKKVPFKPEPTAKDLSAKEYKELQKNQKCMWSSKEHRERVRTELAEERRTGGDHTSEEPQPKFMWQVTWGKKKNCRSAADPAYCAHGQDWIYTVNDAHLAEVCQGKAPKSDLNTQLQVALQKMGDEKHWDAVFPGAWSKVLTQYARFVKGTGLMINGRECTTAYTVDNKCMKKMNLKTKPDCKKCEKGSADCHACCICPTAFRADGVAQRSGKELEDIHKPERN